LCFRHRQQVKCKTNGSYSTERKKRGAVACVYDNEAGNGCGQRSAYSLCCDDGAVRDGKATCAAYEVCDDNRKYRSLDAGADTVQ